MSDLNVALILKLVDHVTGPSKAVLAAMRNVAGAVDGAGRGMIAGGDALNGVIARQREQLSGSALAVGAMAAGAGFAFKKLFLDSAAQFEDFEATLRTVEGSSAAAKASMGWISDFAAKTPFDLASVTEAFVQMRAYGLDPTDGLLQTLGDTASAMNKPVMQAVEAIADAVQGENERLKEFGVTASVEGSKIIYSYTDRFGQQMTATVDKNNRAMITSTLQAIFNGKYAGAMDERAKTWNGLLANIGDQWTRFSNMVMDAGVFDALKDQLERLLAWLNAAAADGTLQFWAERTAGAMLQVGSAIGAVARVVGPVLQAMAGWAEANPEVATGLAQLAVVLAGAKVGMIALRLASIAFLSPIAGILRIVGLVARTLVWLGLTNPFVLLAAAAAAAVWVIYDNWGNIGAWFRRKWDAVRAAFDDGWLKGVVAVIREFNPVTLLSEAMAGLVDYAGQKFAEVGAKIDAQLSGIPLYDAGKAMIRSLWDGAVALVDEMLSSIKKTMLDAFGTTNLFEAGKAMIQSLWNGAVEMVGKMVADIKARLAGMVPEGIMRFLGGGEEAPAPDPAGVVAQNRPPISPSQVNGANVTVNQTVVAAPGMNERQLADEAARRAAAATAAAGRPRQGTSLFDQPEDSIR